jgi:hypothetical protein
MSFFYFQKCFFSSICLLNNESLNIVLPSTVILTRIESQNDKFDLIENSFAEILCCPFVVMKNTKLK